MSSDGSELTRGLRSRHVITRVGSVVILVLACARPASGDTWALAQWGFGALGGLLEGPGTAAIPSQSFDLFENGSVTGTVSASAQVDQLNLGTAAGFSTLNTVPVIISLARSRAFAQTGDLLTAQGLPAGSSGFLVFRGTVSGSNQAVVSATSGSSIGTTMTNVNTALTGYRTSALNHQPASSNTPNYDWIIFQGPFTSVELTDIPVEFEFPITFGTPVGIFFIMQSYIEINFDPTIAITFSAASDFLSTFTITGVELLDANRMPVANASLTALSGTSYPGVGNATTTTTTLTGATTTTTLPAACAALAGLARAQCTLDAAAAAPLCADAIPSTVEKALRARLNAARTTVARAIAATGKKQTRLVNATARKLRALAARARKAAKSGNPKKQISAACGAGLEGLATGVSADLP